MRAAAALMGLGVLGGCAKPVPVVVAPPAPPAGIEGRYRGTARLVRGNQFCPRSGPRVYELTNGVVTLAYSAGGRRRVPLTAAVKPDGSFRTEDGEGVLEGQLVSGTLEVTITSAQCEHRWTMRHVP